MANPKKNLLEAFRDAGRADLPEGGGPFAAQEPAAPEPQPEAPSASTPPSRDPAQADPTAPTPRTQAPSAPVPGAQGAGESGEGTAEPAPATRPEAPAAPAPQPPRSRTEPSPSGVQARIPAASRSRIEDDELAALAPPPAGVNMPGWLPWIAGVGLALVVGIVIGRGVTGDVRASDEEAQGEAAGGSRPAGMLPARPVESPAVPAEAVDRGGDSGTEAPGSSPGRIALLEPANEYTIVVLTVGSTREEYAWAAHDHLKDEGIPVFDPIAVGNHIVVVAGAAPKSGDLDAMKDRIESLSRDGRTRVYEGAYLSPIDELIDRERR